VTKKFGVNKLARDMEKIEPELTVVVGKGPSAAKGRLVTTVVLDRRTTARRVVLYAESDDGSIWRMSAALDGGAQLDEVAQGIPETTTPPAAPSEPEVTYGIDSVSLLSDGRAFVGVTLREEEDGEEETYSLVLVLARVGTAYLVDDLLVSLFESG
jgi:hypothetical protein